MNKYQEAFNRIFNEDTFGLNDTSYIKDGVIYKKDEEIIKELVDKETPMKPIRKGKLNWWHCSKCDCSLMFDNHKYCDHCGQKLDWSDDCE